MNYIDNWFHFYSTTESFEIHKKQGLINPDSICFLEETGQIYTQDSFFGICRERYEKLEQLVLEHDAKIKNILGIEGPSVKDGIVNNIADLVDFLDGFTDEDNLKDFLDAMKTALESQINAVNKALSERLTVLEDAINNDSEDLHNAINTINTQIKAIDVRLDTHDTSISVLNTSLTSHIREYNILKTNYENFKSYAEAKFTAIDSSISSINISINALQQEFTNLDEKFDDVEDEVSEAKALITDSKQLVKELEDRFGETLADFEQFKKDVNTEIDDFKNTVGSPYGIAPLDGDAKVPSAYLPSYVDDVLEYATKAAFPVTGETGKIYVSLDDNLTYRWSGSAYIEISKSLGLGETATTAYPGNKGKKNADDIAAHKADTNNPHNVTKTQLGLDKVNNTSDADKPVSTAQAAAIKVVQDDLTSHKGNKANPHEVTKAQVGLSNVDNTADLDKPISKATQAALDVLDTSLDAHITDKTNPHNVTKEQLGLGNVENTADKDKPISDATQNVLDTKVDKIVGKGLSTNDFTNEEKNKLDNALTNRKLTTEEINKITEKNLGDLIYNTTTSSYVYWDGTSWKEVSNPDALQSHINNKSNPHGVTKAQVGLGNVDNTSDADKPISTAQQEAFTAGAAALTAHVNNKSNPHEVTKAQVGLGNVDNTSDANKPVSTAQQTALNGKVDKVSGKGLSTNDYTTTEKNKLAGIAENANNYSLPTASASTKGGVKIGDRLSMSGEVLSADEQIKWKTIE